MNATELTLREQITRLNTRIDQLKQDLGHRRSDGYVVAAMQRELDTRIAKIKGLTGDTFRELTLLRELRTIAYGDHSADMFNKEK